jgi:hypothetical protein
LKVIFKYLTPSLPRARAPCQGISNTGHRADPIPRDDDEHAIWGKQVKLHVQIDQTASALRSQADAVAFGQSADPLFQEREYEWHIRMIVAMVSGMSGGG